MSVGVQTFLTTVSSRTRFNLFVKNVSCSKNSIKTISTSQNQYPKLFAIWNWRKKSKETTESEKNAFQVALEAEEKVELTEEQILEKRNKSRLFEQHYRLIHDEVPYPEPKYWTHHTVRYKRRTFGRYGEKSGENPGYCWPTEEDLERKLDYERLAYPHTLDELVEKKKEYRRLEKEEFERRTKELDEKMDLVDKLKQEIIERREAKEREIAAAKAKRELLMEEVRRHFGYTVDPRDERFQELLEKKEKAQKKAIKEARKAERQKMLLAKLTEGLEDPNAGKEPPKKLEASTTEGDEDTKKETAKKPSKPKKPKAKDDDDED